MPTPKLTTYSFRVLFGTPDAPREVIVQTVGRDVQRAEAYFADHKWGSTETRPMTAAAVTAYFAMKRDNAFDGPFEKFEDAYLSVEPLEEVVSTPTEPVPVPG